MERDASIRNREAGNDKAGRNHFAGISESDRQFQQTLEKYLSDRNAMNKKQIDLLTVMAGTGTSQQQQLDALFRIVAQLRERQKNGNAGLPTPP